MPAAFPGIRGQTQLDDLLDFSGTITAGGTAQLLLPQQPTRTSFFIINTSAADTLFIGIGPPAATATLSGTGIGSIALVGGNGGIGYTVPPNVRILGGLITGDYKNAPSNPASATATISGGTITAITINNPGSGYLVAPLIYFENPWPSLGGGAYTPASAKGIPITPNGNFSTSGMLIVPTSAVAIWGNTTGDSFTVKVGGIV